MKNERIEKTEQFLKDKFSGSVYFKDHPEDMAYRLEHSFRVSHIGKEIAKAEGMDAERMVVACLLHDIGYCIDFGENESGYRDHGRVGASIARPFLTELGYSKEEVEEICYGIAIHVDDEADFEGERTVFALSIGDADNIDRFDAYRIYEGLEHVHFSDMSLEEKNDYVDKRIEGLKKLKKMAFSTDTAEKMWISVLNFQSAFFGRLKKQISNSTWWSVHE